MELAPIDYSYTAYRYRMHFEWYDSIGFAAPFRGRLKSGSSFRGPFASKPGAPCVRLLPSSPRVDGMLTEGRALHIAKSPEQSLIIHY